MSKVWIGDSAFDIRKAANDIITQPRQTETDLRRIRRANQFLRFCFLIMLT
jgi:hypothetical protein